jgi:SPP1 family predicted phage head-tail adaptor
MSNYFSFNHRVFLQKENQISGEFGEIDSKFENIAEVWANIKPVDSKQVFSRMKNDIEISHVITIRYRDDAKNCKRIVFNNRYFDVFGVVCPNEERDFLVFNVKEIL